MLTAEPFRLHALIDRLLAAPVRTGAPPVLVIRGEDPAVAPDILAAAYERWAAGAPVAMVDAAALDGPHPMRHLLAAIMLGLGSRIAGHRPVPFPRLLLAHVAMIEPIDELGPERAVAAMRVRLDRCHHRTVRGPLVASLLDAGRPAVHAAAPGTRVQAELTAEALVQRLPGWWVRRGWKEPIAWFAHLDQEPLLEPLSTLVQLSVQAGRDDPGVRDGVDDLLTAALLADLRAAAAAAPDSRPEQALVLIDNGDAPAAVALATSLVRVRRALAATARARGGNAPADPLVVVAGGGDRLTAALAGASEPTPTGAPAPGGGPDCGPHPGTASGSVTDVGAVALDRPWLAVRVDGSGAEEVAHLTRERRWRAPLTAVVVAHSVHRLTHRNLVAAMHVLEDLERSPHHLEDFDGLLRRRGPVGDRSLEEHLLDTIVAELSPYGHFDPNLRDNLITLAAARDEDEADQLVGLLVTPIVVNPLALASRARHPGEASCHGRLAALTRYLLLRALADRPDTHPASWHRAFTRLHAGAVERADLAGRLHHELALGAHAAVAAELARQLDELPVPEWLALLDLTVSSPNPRFPEPADPEPDPGDDSDEANVQRLLTHLHALADPALSNPTCLRQLYGRIESNYRALAARRAGDLLIERAERHSALADSLT